MMLGETDALNSFINTYTDDSALTLHYGNLVIIFVVLFVFLVPVLLTNLLVRVELIRINFKIKLQ